MPHRASLRFFRAAAITAFGGLLLAACAQGETLDGFGGSFTSGNGGGSGNGKATGSTTVGNTASQAASSAATKAASSSVATTAATNATSANAVTTVANVSTAVAVTTGGAVCFDVCAEGAAPPDTYPIDCFGDMNTLACITGICIGSADCCEVAWDSTCVIAATIACGCP